MGVNRAVNMDDNTRLFPERDQTLPGVRIPAPDVLGQTGRLQAARSLSTDVRFPNH